MALRFKTYPALAELQEALDYDPETGLFRWVIGPARTVKAGSIAGSRNPTTGYWHIGFRGQSYQGHRLAWLFIHGELPSVTIDHRNLEKTDNRSANLRLASGTEQNANTQVRKDSKSGVKGVRWNNASRRWQVQIKVRGKNLHLGMFDDLDAARGAYEKASLLHFGNFARLAA